MQFLLTLIYPTVLCEWLKPKSEIKVVVYIKSLLESYKEFAEARGFIGSHTNIERRKVLMVVLVVASPGNNTGRNLGQLWMKS